DAAAGWQVLRASSAFIDERRTGTQAPSARLPALRLRARVVAVAAILENPERLALSLLCLLPDKDRLLAGREAAAQLSHPCGHDLARRIVYAGVDTRLGSAM